MKHIVSLVLLTVAVLVAGEDLNGIYLGSCPMVLDAPPCLYPVQITEDGTVIIRKGLMVPLMHDRYGKPVIIRRVELR